MKKMILLLSAITLLMSCNQSNDTKGYTALNKADATTNYLQTDNGYTLMKNNCYACHNPKATSHDEILAPPFKAVKMHYTRAYDSKEEFVNAMVSWVQNPDEDKALMFGAVKRFKVMPKLALPTEDLEKIAAYIYDNDVEQPEWMEEHMKEMKGKM
jgi:mono/diheme cytochrome c family protein